MGGEPVFDAVKIVAVLRDNDEWVAYCGPAHWDENGVALYGDKLPEHIAMWFFGDEARRRKLTWRK